MKPLFQGGGRSHHNPTTPLFQGGLSHHNPTTALFGLSIGSIVILVQRTLFPKLIYLNFSSNIWDIHVKIRENSLKIFWQEKYVKMIREYQIIIFYFLEKVIILNYKKSNELKFELFTWCVQFVYKVHKPWVS